MAMDYPAFVRAAVAPEAVRPQAQEACREIARTLERLAHALVFVGFFPEPNERDLGFGVVVQVAAELSRATITLLDKQQAYGAAALLRQLVEVEYLSWAFSENLGEALRWVKAKKRERDEFFKPVRLRRASNGLFRDSEYRAHCERGGHPHPEAVMFLPIKSVTGDVDRSRGTDDVWDDLTFHLVGIWRNLTAALESHPWGHLVTEEVKRPVTDAIAAWEAAADQARTKLAEAAEGSAEE